jgi:hypothetical protein
MKHIWVVESSGGRKWWPQRFFFTKKRANTSAGKLQEESPGLKWRVAKYARVGGNS